MSALAVATPRLSAETRERYRLVALSAATHVIESEEQIMRQAVADLLLGRVEVTLDLRRRAEAVRSLASALGALAERNAQAGAP